MSNLFRYMTEDKSISIIGINSTEMVERARQIHQTSPVCTAALGRLLTAASMMGVLLKIEDASITLQVKGGGPAGTVLAVADADGNVKGYVSEPLVSLPLNEKGKLDVGGAVGRDGFLSAIKDLRMKEPYIGQVPLVSGEIAEDITNYFITSEQIPTACALGVLVERDYTVKAAGGFLIQALPFAPEEMLAKIEQNLSTMPSVTSILSRGESVSGLISTALGGLPFFEVEARDVGYVCDCSRERVMRAVISIGAADLAEIFSQEDKIHVGCQFCGHDYYISQDDIEKFI